jgi:hypothetical protein
MRGGVYEGRKSQGGGESKPYRYATTPKTVTA